MVLKCAKKGPKITKIVKKTFKNGLKWLKSSQNFSTKSSKWISKESFQNQKMHQNWFKNWSINGLKIQNRPKNGQKNHLCWKVNIYENSIFWPEGLIYSSVIF